MLQLLLQSAAAACACVYACACVLVLPCCSLLSWEQEVELCTHSYELPKHLYDFQLLLLLLLLTLLLLTLLLSCLACSLLLLLLLQQQPCWGDVGCLEIKPVWHVQQSAAIGVAHLQTHAAAVWLLRGTMRVEQARPTWSTTQCRVGVLQQCYQVLAASGRYKHT